MERIFRHSNGGLGVQLVLIFGIGLIGATLTRELSRRDFHETASLDFSWLKSPNIRAKESTAIFEWVCARISAHGHEGIPANCMSISVMWSAGQGGFASTWAALNSELNAFKAVTALSTRLLETLPSAVHHFHLVSSAGGLYEGQLNVGPNSASHPLRPYGELKMAQEEHLGAISKSIGKSIYRPSSVYGFFTLKSRVGLVATLINNGIRGQVTNIFAEALTLRDYVLVGDVAAFIAQKVSIDSHAAEGIYVLASAKPTSISEVLVLLESILGRTLYFVFRSTCDNTASNTYSPRILANGFYPQGLETGMRSVLFDMQHQFSQNFP